MYVRAVRIKKYRHLENVEIGPFREPTVQSDIIALAGANGGGKTSILELIGFALSNVWSLAWSSARSQEGSSFEIELAISKNEKHLIKQHFETAHGILTPEVTAQIDVGTYFRGFSFAEGEYAKNPNHYNQVHSAVTQALRTQYKQHLGFFMRSDRHFAPKPFDNRVLLQYEKQRAYDYAWQWAFNTFEAQYKDIYEFLVGERFHYYRKLGQHRHREVLKQDAGDTPVDPLKPYDALLQLLFPEYKFTEPTKDIPDNLYVELPTRDTIPFNDLSSGEKEVFFITTFFLGQNVQNAVILIDEPELHLHPELARLLIKTMLSVKPHNQIWVATHNPEIIDEAGLDHTTFIERDPATRKAIATNGADEDAGVQQLRKLFGLSGFMGVGRRMVFLEGEESSLDRKIFSRLLPSKSLGIKLIPARTVGNVPRINQAVLAILESSISVSDFYLIRDRDYLTDDLAKKYIERAKGRIYVLNRHHIENYILDDDIISLALNELYERNVTAEIVCSALKEICRQNSLEFLRDMVRYRLSSFFRIEDFSIADFGKGQALFDPTGAEDSSLLSALSSAFKARGSAVCGELQTRAIGDAVQQLIDG